VSDRRSPGGPQAPLSPFADELRRRLEGVLRLSGLSQPWREWAADMLAILGRASNPDATAAEIIRVAGLLSLARNPQASRLTRFRARRKLTRHLRAGLTDRPAGRPRSGESD
jgi:hypothetical protein